MDSWRIYLGLAFCIVQFVILPFWGVAQRRRKAQGRRLAFESRGWKWQDAGEKEVLYCVAGQMENVEWQLQGRKNAELKTTETRWFAPIGSELETGLGVPSFSQKLVGNPLAFGAMRWFVRREMKKQHELDAYQLTERQSEEDQNRMTEEMLRVSQALLRPRPLYLEALSDFCILNSLWREESVREVFDSQIERDLALFLSKLTAATRKTFVCRLEKKQILLRVGADLPAPLAIEMSELGVQIAARARRFSGQEADLLNTGPIRRALRNLPASQREELRGKTPLEMVRLFDGLGEV